MIDLAEALKAEPPRLVAKKERPTGTFSIRALRRLAVWAMAAAGALLIAVLTSRSQIGLERIALVFGHHPAQVATSAVDPQAGETQRLADAVRGLTASEEQIRSRLAAVEHNLDDVTGSVSKQIEAASATRRSDDGPSVAATAAVSVSLPPPTASLPPILTSPPATVIPSAEAASSGSRPQYGVDIGSGLTVEALRARWDAIRSAHPQLFVGLQPVVNVKEVPRANRIELRLIAGPIAEPVAAAKLCASLSLFALYCQPTIFDGQHLALR
jgi:hypothetical protein